MRHFLIPARGGSKGVPDKNIRDLGGRPLIAWTIETALAVAGTGNVVVNSDDTKILDIAEGYGAETYQRPEYLAGDESSMRDVVKEYFEKNAHVEEIVLLFPCVPFRTQESIRRALGVYDLQSEEREDEGGRPSLMSVGPCNRRPFGGVNILDGKLAFEADSEAFYRKQDTPTLYFANGSIFIIHRDELPLLNTQLFNKDTIPFVMDGVEDIDIDTEFDLRIAAAVVKSGMVRGMRRGGVVKREGALKP